MLAFSYIIKHIITNKYKNFVYIFIHYLKMWKKKHLNPYLIRIQIYIYMIDLSLVFTNLYKINVKNKTMNLYSTFYVLFIRNKKTKNLR